MITSKYFKEEEFRRCDPSCSLQDMDQDFMSRLDEARELAGIPFVITSAYRCSAWDKAFGRSGTGAHTLGKAMDIRCNSSANRYKIVQALLAVGFTRVGIDNGFIHVDSSTNHAQNVIWTY